MRMNLALVTMRTLLKESQPSTTASKYVCKDDFSKSGCFYKARAAWDGEIFVTEQSLHLSKYLTCLGLLDTLLSICCLQSWCKKGENMISSLTFLYFHERSIQCMPYIQQSVDKSFIVLEIIWF